MGAISGTTETNGDRLVENNVRLSLDLWEFCREQARPFIYASSAATYGDGAAGYTKPFTSLEDGVADYIRNYLEAADPYS